MAQTLSDALVNSIVGGYNGDPFAVLGPHSVTQEGEPALAVRAFLPWAASLQVALDEGSRWDAWRIHPAGFFEAIILHSGSELPGYVLRVDDGRGNTVEMRDPYSFGPLLSDFD